MRRQSQKDLWIFFAHSLAPGARPGRTRVMGIRRLIDPFGSSGLIFAKWTRDGRDGRAKTGGMVRALTVRIGLSVLLFLCILLAWKLGYIQPGGLPVGH